MGPLAGVMVCHYYIIVKRKLNLHEMYNGSGIYYYQHGFNWRAWAAFIIGFAPLMPGFAKSIDNTLNVGGAWKLYTFAWIYGFVTSVLVYYIICTYISKPSSVMIDEAVYPRQRGEPAPEHIEGKEVTEELKDPYLSSEKEVSPV